MSGTRESKSSISIDDKIRGILSSKAGSGYKPPVYSDEGNTHSSHIGDKDWALLNYVLRKALGDSDSEAFASSNLEELTLIIARGAKSLQQSIENSIKGTNLSLEEIKAINNNFLNAFFANSLKEYLEKIPENTRFFNPLTIASIDAVDNTDSEKLAAGGEGHVLSASFRKKAKQLYIDLYDSFPLDYDKQRAAEARLIQQLIAALLEGQYEVSVQGHYTPQQASADCTLHAVFNAVMQEKGFKVKPLSFEDCTALRQALDEVNDAAGKTVGPLEVAVENLLLARKLTKTPADKSPDKISRPSQSPTIPNSLELKRPDPLYKKPLEAPDNWGDPILEQLKELILNPLETELGRLEDRVKKSAASGVRDNNLINRHVLFIAAIGDTKTILNQYYHDKNALNCKTNLIDCLKTLDNHPNLAKYDNSKQILRGLLNVIALIFTGIVPGVIKYALTGSLFFSTQGKTKDTVDQVLEQANKLEVKATPLSKRGT